MRIWGRFLFLYFFEAETWGSDNPVSYIRSSRLSLINLLREDIHHQAATSPTPHHYRVTYLLVSISENFEHIAAGKLETYFAICVWQTGVVLFAAPFRS